MKFLPKFRTKKLRILFTILGSFCSFLNGEGDDVRPLIMPRKTLEPANLHRLIRDFVIHLLESIIAKLVACILLIFYEGQSKITEPYLITFYFGIVYNKCDYVL